MKIDARTFEFGGKSDDPNFKGGSELFDGDGETFCLEPSDLPFALTFTARPHRFELVQEARAADVSARGTASDLLLFLWGRVPSTALAVTGDASLLERWQERVKI